MLLNPTTIVKQKVSIGKKLVTSTEGLDVGSTFVWLKCSHCSRILGKKYHSTSRRLDRHRGTLTLSLDRLESYELGSSQAIAESRWDDPPLSSYNQLMEQILKMKVLLVTLNQRVCYLESLLPPDPAQPSQLPSNAAAVAPSGGTNSSTAVAPSDGT
ncbi:kinetochore protein mis18 isoform X2 [Lingula anatina]|nr:kinetochore protein mis18 isoform X2 [Lingula anatina]|eukprot:XP_013418233.1 kinetochore protein mis18 isoform X2 [Lingula anatina]